jgi:hypothetical protein
MNDSRIKSHHDLLPKLAISESYDVAPEVSPVLDALEQFAQFVDELFDTPRSHPIAWEGNPNRIAVRSVGRVLCKWRHAVKPNRPPSALIVRLARRLPSVLSDVVQHPKKILQRRRSMEPINRLRELDSSCVRWLTRQPGNTLAEKSGHRRAVLAVQRFESVDTLENRVVLDLLKRCSALASNYLRQHQAAYPNHEWIRMTADFLTVCRRLETLPHLREVSSLPSLPKPNYVLLHETRYKQVWRSYMEVIRQQRRRQQLWTWRHQAFADMVIVAWMYSASRLATDRESRKAAHRFDLRIRETPQRGTFFDWTSLPPIWKVTPESSFYIGPSDSLRHLPIPDVLIPSVEKFAKNFGFAAEAKNLEEFRYDPGISVVRWNKQEGRANALQVLFGDDYETIGTVPDLSAGLANIRLLDVSGSNESDQTLWQRAVPLTLIEAPDAFDQVHSDWWR